MVEPWAEGTYYEIDAPRGEVCGRFGIKTIP
jgi:hypothetical protein